MDFKTLQKKWYLKLKDVGFEDIETVNGTLKKALPKAITYPDDVKNKVSMFKSQGLRNESVEQEAHRKAIQREIARNYYEIANSFLHSERFLESTKYYPHHRKIWEMHCEGVKNKEIEKRTKMCRQSITYVLTKYRKLMKT